MPDYSSSFKVKPLKINNIVEHNVNSLLEGFKSYYSTLVEDLVKLLTKPPNKYSINTVIKCYQHMIYVDHFNLPSASGNSILTTLKATQVSKVAGLDNLSRRFVKNGTCNLSISYENLPGSYKVAKPKPLYAI